jgi:hypothetical protein
VPCPPGTFSSAAGDTCTECLDGKFQDGFGQTLPQLPWKQKSADLKTFWIPFIKLHETL